MRLPVKNRLQWGQGANASNSDCGQACVAMLLEYISKKHVDVDQITRHLHDFDTTNWNQLREASSFFGLELGYEKFKGLADIAEKIKEGKPCLVLVDYGKIPKRVKEDQKYKGGHFILVTGVGDSVWYNDPNFPTQTWRGQDVEIGKQEFLSAWEGGQFLYPTIGRIPMTEEEIKNLRSSIVDEVINKHFVPMVRDLRRRLNFVECKFVRFLDDKKTIAEFSRENKQLRAFSSMTEFEDAGWQTKDIK